MFRKFIDHRIFYLLGLYCIAIGLPLSIALMSIGLGVLGINWLIEGEYKQKWRKLKSRPALWFFLTIYIVHIIGMIYSENLDFGLIDLRKKIILFIIPLVIGTTKELGNKEIEHLFTIFILAVFVSSLCSILVLLGWAGPEITDTRQISIFIDHIRLALMVNLALFSSIYFLFISKNTYTQLQKILFFTSIIWFPFFIFLLKSITGIVLLIIITIAVLFLLAKNSKKIWQKLIIYFSILSVIAIVSAYIIIQVTNFYNSETIDPYKIEKVTRQGNLYTHDLNSKQTENGHFIYIYICDKELRESWNKISSYSYDGLDNKKQNIRSTLIRYLTSKGLRKDADGVAKLTRQDIKNIENGLANIRYANKNSLNAKTYEVIWQIDRYKKGGNPTGHSITQRYEYFKTGIKIFIDNPIIGVGTGDVEDKFLEYYKKLNSPLSTEWRLRAHNQYVTFMLSFGSIGFIIILICLIYPIYKEKVFGSFLLNLFLAIALLSMLNEDSLEIHAGITFFSFFYALLVFGHDKKSESNKNVNAINIYWKPLHKLLVKRKSVQEKSTIQEK